MLALFPLLSIVCGVVVPWTGTRPPLVGAIVTLTACTGVVIAWARHDAAGDIWSVAYGTFLSGFVVALILQLVAVIRQLTESRQELAETAVNGERLRFARDLHDLLGHIVGDGGQGPTGAQAGLAGSGPGRRAGRRHRDRRPPGPDRGATVSGRLPRTGIAYELAEARTALADAGFTVDVRQDDVLLAAAVDALLVWVIREGATNVIRHSGGH